MDTFFVSRSTQF